jgi:hypothetical protein
LAIAEALPPEDDVSDGANAPADSKDPRALLQQLQEWSQDPNVAFDIEEDVAGRIATRVIEEYEIDKASRSEWEEEARTAMDAVLQKTEAKSHPWPGAANVKFPLLTTAALQFGARSYPAIVQGDRVVRVKTVGPDPLGLKSERAERISLHMSHQLLEEQDGWESDLDIMLHQLPIIGHGYRKVYRDTESKGPQSDFVSAMNLVVNQGTKDIRRVPRATEEVELYPHEIEERIRDERFVPFEYAASSSTQMTEADGDQSKLQMDDDAPHLFLEQHRYWDLDGDGLKEPWIATVHKESGKLVRLQANYDLEKAVINKRSGEIAKLPRYQFFVGFPFIPDPNGGYHGIGFGRLLKSIGETVNTALNQMLDAGTLQNMGGGFIGSGLNVKKSKITVRMNEWTVVNVPGQKIREAVVPHQFAGPSTVLFQLLGLMIDAGKQIASVQDVLTGEKTANTMQPTTLLALIEQGLKVFTAIIKRVFRSLKREFELIYDLNLRAAGDPELAEEAEAAYAEIIDWQPPQELIEKLQEMEQQAAGAQTGGEGQPGAMPGGGAPMPGAAPAQAPAGPQQPPQIPPEITARLQPPTMAADYDHKDRNVVPVADPNAVTDMQALAKAQVIQSTFGHPAQNPAEALRRVYQAAKIEDIDKLIVEQQGPDPLTLETVKVKLRGEHAAAADKMASANLKKKQAERIDAEVGHTQAKTQETQAKTAKTTVDTQSAAQDAAITHAEAASGMLDAERSMELALKEAQVNKTHTEARVASRVKKAESGASE